MVFAVRRYIIPSDSDIQMDTSKNEKVNQIRYGYKEKRIDTL